jgi:hypothetical protein
VHIFEYYWIFTNTFFNFFEGFFSYPLKPPPTKLLYAFMKRRDPKDLILTAMMKAIENGGQKIAETNK